MLSHHSNTDQGLDCRDTVLSRVAKQVLSGWSSTAEKTFISYQRRRDELSWEDGCVMWGNCVVLPEISRQKVLLELHVGHPGMSRMEGIARGVVWWPGINADMENQFPKCAECQEHKKSPAATSQHPLEWPAHPWEPST